MVFAFHTLLSLAFCLVDEQFLNCPLGLVLLCIFNSLFFLIAFFVLQMSQLSRLTSEFFLVLNYVMCIRIRSKEQNQKKCEKHIKPGH